MSTLSQLCEKGISSREKIRFHQTILTQLAKMIFGLDLAFQAPPIDPQSQKVVTDLWLANLREMIFTLIVEEGETPAKGERFVLHLDGELPNFVKNSLVSLLIFSFASLLPDYLKLVPSRSGKKVPPEILDVLLILKTRAATFSYESNLHYGHFIDLEGGGYQTGSVAEVLERWKVPEEWTRQRGWSPALIQLDLRVPLSDPSVFHIPIRPRELSHSSCLLS